MLSPETWMTTKEIADRLGLTEGRVCQLFRDGSLSGTKVGRAWVATQKDIESFEQSDRRAPGNPNFGPDFWSSQKSG
jgi:excisionase family DNA binding protein